jgi:penicillin amidase
VIRRDRWGVPHIEAASDTDLFFGFGYAMAQDRLFQFDWLRRKATGCLAEVLGPEGVEADTVARTLDLRGVAQREWAALPAETRALLVAFSGGINAAMAAAVGRLPVEFDLLDYAPAAWAPLDSLAILAELRAYLTVRLPVIAIPELLKRALGEGPRYRAALHPEADDETILPDGPPGRGPGPGGVSGSGTGVSLGAGEPDDGRGSNNWAVAGSRTASGQPLVASDPHIAFAAVSCWYEVHLAGGSFDTVGTAYAGMPAVFFGRNRRVAWGITNNICSQRDLYRERTDPAHPGAFLHDGRWEPATERVEEIRVRAQGPVRLTVRASRNGPIVDHLLPSAARPTGPVALRWHGHTAPCGWLTAMLAVNRARTCDELRAALRGWRVPTLSLVFADADGHIGYQAAGEIPVRRIPERGYRPGWDPAHQWDGVIPFEAMPRLADPARGWVATANNRPAAEFPYPLAGTWSSGHRARRIRQMLEATPRVDRAAVGRMHQDALSLRAAECRPRLLRALAAWPLAAAAARAAEVRRHLEAWDGRMEPDSVGAAVFGAFFPRFCRAVAAARLPVDQVTLVADALASLATELLDADALGWFPAGRWPAVVGETFLDTLEHLAARLGSDPATWTWGRLHQIRLTHVLSGRGDLGRLLDRGGLPVRGDGTTVCNTGFDPNYLAPIGANYRLIADLGETPAGLHAVDAQGQSGHPGSPHYGDQLAEWLGARYHFLPLDQEAIAPTVVATLRLEPA